MVDKLKSGTKAWAERQRRHKHNSFHGHVKMAQANMQSILLSQTATDESKDLARDLYAVAADLGHSLKKRRPRT